MNLCLTFWGQFNLWDKPIIVSRQALDGSALSKWLQKDRTQLNITAIYNLVFNASLLVEEGMGYALSIDKIINVSGNTDLCFRPLYPKLEIEMKMVWKKYQVLSKASEKFLQQIQNLTSEKNKEEASDT